MSWHDDETTVILSGGPVRVDTSEPDPEFEPRPVGFVQKWAPVEPRTTEQVESDRILADVLEGMPLLWEGDQA